MRFSFGRACGLLILLSSGAASFAAKAKAETTLAATRPALLDQAFNAFAKDQGRWAYTETHSAIVDGQPTDERQSIFKVDPSRSDPEQFTPVKLGGKLPTEKDFKQWAERGEKAAKRRQQQGAEEEKSPVHRNEEVQILIFNQEVMPLLEQAVVVAEDETGMTYDVPMRKAGEGETARFDAFQLTVRVSKQRREFERATIRQRLAMRVAAGKYTDGLIEIEFGSPDPRFPAVPVKISSRTTNKPMFGKAVTGQTVSVRTEMRHVTPYDERFGVIFGPLRTIEF